jgi:hypothetical protein
MIHGRNPFMTQDSVEAHAEETENTSLSSVGEAVKEGAADAKQGVETILPAVGKFVSKALYGGCYYAAYGVTFGALTVGKLIPTDNAVVHGLQDGAEAAAADIQKRSEAVAEATVETATPTSEEGLATA